MSDQPTRHFTELVVWQKAHQFVLEINKATKSFPKDELYGLTSQIRRAAVSVPANIAEGYRRRGTQDKARFLNTAQSSLDECRYLLMLGSDLEYLEASDARFKQADEVARILYAYENSVRRAAK
ncbi:MAG TPA: four helix bundle protein [Phycisphaerales bacterium]|nr:four helix bundle protein [Phycisphaerales bacterium]